MANLPRFGRTWQRFSSLPRPAPAAASEADQAVTEPQIVLFAPPTTQTLPPFEEPTPSSRLPSPPPKKLASPPSSPKYRPTATSPSKPAPLSPTPTYNRYDGERRASATSSPKTFKPTQTSPPLSHPAAAAAPPLSPPRTEAKPVAGPTTRSMSPPAVEQKTILFQKITEKPARSDNRQSEVITIRGENVGAAMRVNQSSEGTEIFKEKQTEGSSHENDGRKKTSAKDKDKESKLSRLPVKPLMNRNFQGVNNSLVYNSSCSHRDPGLHLGFSRKTSHGEPQLDSRR